jgi:hypothetical protein
VTIMCKENEVRQLVLFLILYVIFDRLSVPSAVFLLKNHKKFVHILDCVGFCDIGTSVCSL